MISLVNEVDSNGAQLLREQLRAVGLRATAPRIAVLGVLASADGPLSHGDVSDQLERFGYDRATIYRNLTDLTDAGLARRFDHGDHVWRFELKREESHEHDESHAHFVCSACGVVLCLPATTVNLESQRSTPKAIRTGNIEIQLRGVCDTCTD